MIVALCPAMVIYLQYRIGIHNGDDGCTTSVVLCSCNISMTSFSCVSVYLLQSNCDPRFFTTVIFYAGHLSLSTQLKLEVFDVLDRREGRVSSMPHPLFVM